MKITEPTKLGELLLERGTITSSQLEAALKKQEETKEKLGVTLQRMGLLKDDTLLPTLALQWGVEYVRLKEIEIPADIIRRLPARLASYYKVIPYATKDNTLKIATTDPQNIFLLDELSVFVKGDIQLVLAENKDIDQAIRRYYGVGASTIEAMMNTTGLDQATPADLDRIDENTTEASIAQFINQILLEAFREGVTDVHIEPYEDDLKVRYRIDGILRDARVPPNIKHFKDVISSRIKVLSRLNIAEKRLPQDGRFKVKVGAVELDLRVSFLPTPLGESVVLRILNSARLYSFEELGLNKEEERILRELIQKPNGIIFLTGPTGSGKTTTLYTCLSRMNHDVRKIITLEDPIEYRLKGITQIQVNPAIGLTFAKGLRSMLRHDPNIMMVGEVRDLETAQIAIQVALTGHLIFSTLHTNDAVGGVARLLDMGIEPYLITSTIRAFIAQRLVRLLCPQCKERAQLKKELWLDHENKDFQGSFYQAKGCEACQMTGYTGREAIYEILLMDDSVRALIMQRKSAVEIKEIAVHRGMRTLRQSGWEKVKKGLTTVEEILRVAQEEDQE